MYFESRNQERLTSNRKNKQIKLMVVHCNVTFNL